MSSTTPLLADLAQSFYSMILGLYVLSFFGAAISYSRFRMEFSFQHLVLSYLALIYTLFCLMYTFGPLPQDLNERVFPTVSVLGAAAFLYYIETLESFFHKKLPFKKVMSFPAYVFIALMSADFLLQLSGLSSFLFEPAAQNSKNWYMQNILGDFRISPYYKIVSLLPALTLLSLCMSMLWTYRTQLKNESLVLIGVLLTLITQINDITIMVLNLPFIFPLSPLGYVCETLRFNTHIVERNLEQTQKIRNSLNDSLQRAQPSLLTQQILHDSLAILRPLENLSEKQLEAKYVRSLALEGKRRLRAYENSFGLWNTNSFVRANECFELAVQLYSSELKKQDIQVGFPDRSVSISFHPTDLLLVFTNLIQNSIEALQAESAKEKWIRLEVFSHTSTDVSLRYTDSGKPPAKEVASRLFEIGYSTKGEGRGMGLNLVREAMLIHRGRIFYEYDGMKTSFRLQFKTAKAKSAHLEAELLPPQAPA